MNIQRTILETYHGDLDIQYEFQPRERKTVNTAANVAFDSKRAAILPEGSYCVLMVSQVDPPSAEEDPTDDTRAAMLMIETGDYAEEYGGAEVVGHVFQRGASIQTSNVVEKEIRNFDEG